ncbi:MAG: hypothetical protein AAGA42_13820 [Actinomycetota bacterium]
MHDAAPPPITPHTGEESPPNEATDASPSADTLVTIRPWIDPLVDDAGFDPRSRYVETCWLGVLGPTATWLLRRLVDGLDREPEGYTVDLTATARSMGLGYQPDRPTSPFGRALQRCVMFGAAHALSDGYAVRRRLPPVTSRHLRRLPNSVREAHDAWTTAVVTLDGLTRAHRLAMALRECGDDVAVIEHHLVALGVDQATAATVADNERLTAAQAGAAP